MIDIFNILSILIAANTKNHVHNVGNNNRQA